MARDKNLQRFVIFLVKRNQNAAEKFRNISSSASGIAFSKAVMQGNAENDLDLFIYTDRLLSLEIDYKICYDSTIFVIESKDCCKNTAYIVIDSAS